MARTGPTALAPATKDCFRKGLVGGTECHEGVEEPPREVDTIGIPWNTHRRTTVATKIEDCLFCKIVAGELPSTTVGETERTLAFRDLHPQAPTHVLVIPKGHHEDAAAMAAADGSLFGEVIDQAHEVAQADGIADDGYRLVFNTGREGGQTVYHVHCHVLGGRHMTWPPG